jgi:zinc D-Ala-D-Ala dipeptidase
MIPKEFSYIQEICPKIRIVASYATKNNFVGEVIDGYKSKKLVLLTDVITSLEQAQKLFLELGYSIVVYDAYRPEKAVAHFWRWASDPCEKTKDIFYPHCTKAEVFEQGFIAKRSTHSRGAAIDMSLYSIETGEELDMGGIFDCFDQVSFSDSKLINKKAQSNRKILLKVMLNCGFMNFSKEWWHFSYKKESSPEKYWNFDI